MNKFYLAVVLCLFLATIAAAQPNDVTKPAIKPAADKTAKDPEAERLAKQRRDTAQALLISLAAEAGRFSDQTLRARTQARIADVLWSADPDRARAMFRKAWESAEIVDQEVQRKLQEEIAQQKAKNGGNVAVTGPRDIRSEVLRLAARHDRALGEEFLSKLKTEKQREATDAADKAPSNPFDAPEAARQRLNLARQLLEVDVARALQFADPVLGNITRDAVDFLSYLREKDPAAADQRYAALLAMAMNNLQSDANIVSLLGSYVFTPHTFVTFDNKGSSVSSSARGGQLPAIPLDLRNAFFNTAVEILLRPMAPPGQDQSTSGIQGKYLMLKRLLPLFEQYSSKELSDAVRTQMDAMSNLVSEDTRKQDDNTLREGIRPAMNTEDREKAMLDRVDRAKTSEQRDQLYLQLARLFIDSDDNKARDYVDKIEDADLRKQARPFIDASMMMRAADKKNVDRLLDFVCVGGLTSFQTGWGVRRAGWLGAWPSRRVSPKRRILPKGSPAKTVPCESV